MKFRYHYCILVLIVLLSAAMHFKHFSEDLTSIHVWRQTQTQSTIVNFYEENMNIFKPLKNDRGDGDGLFRMEFPLMQWLVACIYKVLGNHIIITRLFMFVTGLLSLLGMYRMLQTLFENKIIALVGAWTFNFSPCFYYYTINPLPDNFALCCAIWGIVFFFNWYKRRVDYLLLSSGLLLSIGALCKLPFILYLVVPLTYFLICIVKRGISKRIIFNTLMILSFMILPLAWYISVVPQWNGNGIVNGILDSRISISEYLDYLQHNLISTLPELLLNYGSVPFFLLGFFFTYKNKTYKHSLFPVFIVWSIAILAYFFFELNMIAKIHDYYLFPFYPLLFILVSYGAYQMFIIKRGFTRYLFFILLLILPFTTYLRMKVRWDLTSPGFNRDLLVYKEELRHATPKNALCVVGNDESHFIYFYYLDKKGWGFNDDDLNSGKLRTMIEKGAKYLYSDSRNIDNSKYIKPLLDTLIVEKGSVKVFKLKQNSFN